MTPEEIAQLKAVIDADADLKAKADAGNDAAVLEHFNVVRDTVTIERTTLSPNFMVGLAASAFVGAAGKQSAPLMQFWSVMVTAATGFTEPIQASDPTLLAQLAAALTQEVLTQSQVDYYTKRPGSIAESILERQATNEDIARLR
jgi:hypothetical protein